jgi:two-component sensor histidine kinase
MGELIRGYDWSRTSIGPIDQWPQTLRTVTDMLLLSPVPIVLLWGEDGVMIYNDAYSVFAGSKHPQLLGSAVRQGWPEVADFNDNVMRVGLSGRTLSYQDHQLWLDRRGKLEPAWMNLDYSPVLDEDGAPVGVIAIVVETTDRILAERRLAESEARFRALVSATSDVIYQMSPDWSEMLRLDGRGLLRDVDAPTIRWKDDYLLPEDLPEVQAAIDEAFTQRKPFQLEHRVRQRDGSFGWVFSRGVPILDDEGKILEWFGAASDVTERRLATDHLRLVVNELNHRVKNNLAMVQSIAFQTFRDTADIKDARERYFERLVALAQASDLLTGEKGAGASIGSVIDQAVAPHVPSDGRLSAEGPDIRLSAKTALSLSLALHELCTNAVKHGAWSNDHGAVKLSWSTASDGCGGPDRLHLHWVERDGPPVAQPGHRGFGSRLIERGLASELRGKVTLSFDRTGLRCDVEAPLVTDEQE